MEIAERVFGGLANLIQVATFVFTIVVLLRTRRNLQQWLERQERESGRAPAALAIGLAGGIRGHVAQYLKAQGMDMPIEDVDHPEFVALEHYPELLREMLSKKNKLSDMAVSELHLFYKGPVALAVGIGAVFDNWVPVTVYEFKDGTYHKAFVIEKESVRGLLPEMLEEGQRLMQQALQG